MDDLNPSDLIVGAISIDTPMMTGNLVAEGFDIAPQPFAAIVTGGAVISLAALQVGWPPPQIVCIPAEAGGDVRGGHAIPIEELLEPEWDQEQDDEEAIITILMLLSQQRDAEIAAVMSAWLAT
jgi:hypothetical protein